MASAPKIDGARRRSASIHQEGAPRLTLVVRHRAASEVTPAYIRRLAAALEDSPVEVFIADETLRIGATDLLAAAKMEGLPVRVLRARSAVVLAVTEARGEYVALVDADERHPPELLAEMLFQAASSGVDLVFAVRHLPGAPRRAAEAILGERVHDVTDPLTPFFLARKALALPVLPKPGRTLLALDLLLAHPAATFSEIPIARAARSETRARPPLRRRVEVALHVARLGRLATSVRTQSLKDRATSRAVALRDEGLKPWMMLALIGIIATAAALRFWALPQLHWYGQDESHASLASWRMIHDHKPVLTGQPTSRGVYLGPGYFYLVAPFYLLFGGSPFAGAFLAALAGVIAAYFVWRLGRAVFSPGAGLAAALIFATAPIAVYFGRFGWNPNTLPFFAAVFLYGLIRGSPRWIAVSAFCAGMAPQLHATGLILPATLVLWLFSRRPKLGRRGWSLTALAFALPLLPMAAGEIHTRFAGVKSWVRLLTGRGAAGVDTGGSFVKAFKDLFVESIGTPRFTVAAALVIVALLGIVSWERRIWNDPVRGPAFRTIAMFQVVGVIAAVAWHGQMFAYWLLPWLPGAIVLFAGGLVEAVRVSASWLLRRGRLALAAPALAVLTIASFNVAAVARPLRLPNQLDAVSPAAFANVDGASRWIAARVHGTFRLEVYTPYAWDTAHNSTGAFDYLLLRRGLRATPHGEQHFVIAMEDVATPRVQFVRQEVTRAFVKAKLLGVADFGGLSVLEYAG